jgi:predicted outer membrane repeat protein
VADFYLFKNSHPLSVSTRQALMTMLTAGLLALLALTLPQKAWANGPIYVDKDAPGPVHDGASWTTAYTDVQDALAAATPGDEIWVAEGVYMPGGTRAATFQLKNGVALYGGFGGYGIGETLRTQRDWVAHVTVLSGDIDRNDVTDPNGVITTTANIIGINAYHVITGSGTDATAVLDGCTVTAGYANKASPNDRGGGIFNFNGSLTLTDVSFSGNFALHFGGGMYNAGGSPMLSGVTFSGNSAGEEGGGMHNNSGLVLSNVTFIGNSARDGGGMYVLSGEPVLTSVTFSENIASESGGGMYNENNASPTLTDVVFSGNSTTWNGGGMYNWGNPTLTDVVFSGNSTAENGGGMYNDGRFDGSSPTLTNITFSDNSAGKHGGAMANNHSGNPILINATFTGNSAGWSGGGIYNEDKSSPTLINVAFSGNSASWGGGGMANEYLCNPTLINVTFSGNSAAGDGGAMDNSESSATLTNCVLWGNSSSDGSQISNVYSNPSVTYSLVKGGYPGTGNLSADPLFVDADGSDNTVGTLDDNLRLQLASPAIDAGDNSAVPADSTDLDGDGDTTEPLPLDMAGNPRFIDIADKADTGNGTAPIVDVGAYETVVAGPMNYCYLPIVSKNWVHYGTP